MVQIANIIDRAPKDFRVWSGNDDETFSIMCVGGYGVVSVASNIIGNQIKTMMTFVLDNQLENAAKEHRRMLAIFKALFWVTNPVPIKYAVNRSGFNAGSPRVPMCLPDAGFRKKFEAVMDSYDIDLPVG